MTVKTSFILSLFLTFNFLHTTFYSFSQIWNDVGGGTNNNVYALGKYNNKLIVTGGDTFGITPINGVASWDGVVWDSVYAGTGPSFGGPYCFSVFNNELYAGGNFLQIDGVTNTYHIARWNGSNWLSAGSTNNDLGQFKAMTTYNNNLYVGGDITKIGGVNVNRMAKWNGSNWSNVGGGITGGFMTQVTAMATLNNKLYVAGDFGYAGTQVAFNIASWDGTQWLDLDTGLSDRATSMVADTAHNKLYVAGAFNLVGGINGINVNYIAGWNGSNWFSLGQGLSGGILCMTMYHGDLYVGGSMLIVGSDSATIYMARWDGFQWHKVLGPNSTVFALEVYKDTLYVGGAFTLPYENIARYYSPLNSVSEEKKSETEYLGDCIPNPTNGVVTVPYYIPPGSKGSMMINNTEGKQINIYHLKEGNNNLEISLAGYKNGLYFYTLTIDEGRIICHKKMILNK